MRKIQSNPPINRYGEIEVYVNDEVSGSIPDNGSRLSKTTKSTGSKPLK